MKSGYTECRVLISTTGSDANDCSNPLTSCADFAGALAQVATGGEVIAEATGLFGRLNITKSLTISGPPGVVIYRGQQVTVNALAGTVVLRDLTIDGTCAMENGINVVAVGTLYIESCVVAGVAGSRNTQYNGIYFGSRAN